VGSTLALVDAVLTYQVIGDVSHTLQTILNTAMQAVEPTWRAELHDLAPVPSPLQARQTIFLYDIAEDASARNRPLERRPGLPSHTHKKPPIALVLRYMLTAWAGDRISEHRMMGRAIQVLYDHAILSGPQLDGVLAGSNEALKLTLAPISLDERAQVWQAINATYHLSVNYEVRVVHIEAEREQHVPTVLQVVAVPVAGTP
jgi:hypothetical protein